MLDEPASAPSPTPQIARFGIEEIAFEATEHFRMMRSFCNDPHGSLEETLGP
jgi:predicted ATPase